MSSELQLLREQNEKLIVQLKTLAETEKKSLGSDIATGILHNVGNVLNSVNVSVGLLGNNIKSLHSERLARGAALLAAHSHDIEHFINNDPQGKLLPIFLVELSKQISNKKWETMMELVRLQEHVNHIKSVIATQQAFAKSGGLYEECSIRTLINDALALGFPMQRANTVKITCELQDINNIWLNRHSVLQILVNLIDNAQHALVEGGVSEKRLIIIAALCKENKYVRIEVIDNGIGIEKSCTERIFANGFSTKKSGHGFGLYHAARAARDMGGLLTCESEGLGMGARFILEVPVATKKSDLG